MLIHLLGSPRDKKSTSLFIANLGRVRLPEDKLIFAGHDLMSEEEIKRVEDADTIALHFPLYVDAIPAPMLKNLVHLHEQGLVKGKNVYAFINNGYYEPEQSIGAMEVVKIWAKKSGACFQGGLLIGGGPYYLGFKRNPEAKEVRPLVEKLDEAFSKIEEGQDIGITALPVPISRDVYIEMNNNLWERQAEKNGLRMSDLDKRW